MIFLTPLINFRAYYLKMEEILPKMHLLNYLKLDMIKLFIIIFFSNLYSNQIFILKPFSLLTLVFNKIVI